MVYWYGFVPSLTYIPLLLNSDNEKNHHSRAFKLTFRFIDDLLSETINIFKDMYLQYSQKIKTQGNYRV